MKSEEVKPINAFTVEEIVLLCYNLHGNKYEGGELFMSQSPLIVKSKEFALETIRACKILREAKCESALINQYLRSGTSIGANIREAFYAHGKADFIAKLHIALKECSETEYWLELLIESGYYSDKATLDKCVELKKILIASLNTAKENLK